MLKKTRIKRTDLFNSILTRIDDYDYFKVLNDKTRLNIATSLFNFIENSINKYIKGQKEHGGNIIDKDLHKEIKQEIIDLFWYSEAEVWKEVNENIKRKNSKKNKYYGY